MLKNHHFIASVTFIRNIFKSWNWSWKKPDFKQPQKYTTENINYYFTYLDAIQTIPIEKLHFLDECHFECRKLRNTRGLGPVGKRICLSGPSEDLNLNFSLTLVTQIKANFMIPFSYTIREGSNTAEDFLESVKIFLEMEIFEPGDYLIVDNASVHLAQNILPQLQVICNQNQIYLKLLPTYSPELNPAERIFAQVKNWIRNHRSNRPFCEDLIEAFATVSIVNVISYYLHCIDPTKITSY